MGKCTQEKTDLNSSSGLRHLNSIQLASLGFSCQDCKHIYPTFENHAATTVQEKKKIKETDAPNISIYV